MHGKVPGSDRRFWKRLLLSSSPSFPYHRQNLLWSEPHLAIPPSTEAKENVSQVVA